MLFKKKRKGPPLKSAEFKKIVSKIIAPKLRELGWKGSGLHYKRMHNDYPFIDIIGFQVNNYGGTFCVEIGVHPKYLKDSWEGEYDLKKLTHASLDIRKRLTPNNEFDYWWDIGYDEASTVKILDKFWSTFISKATNYFDFFSNFPIPFNSININQNEPEFPEEFSKYVQGMTEVRLHWFLAQTFDYMEDKTKAFKFAELGLKGIKGKTGSGLITDFKELIDKNAV